MNEILFNETINLALDINSLSIQARGDVVRLLQRMEKELLAKVTEGGLTQFQQARISQQLSEAGIIIRNYYEQAAGLSIDTTKEVAILSATASAQALTAAVGGAVTVVLPDASVLEVLASNALIQGAPQKAYWDKQAGDVAFRFASAVRQGMVAGETMAQVAKRVRGELDVSRRNASALTHTSMMTVLNAARDKVNQDNADIVKGVEWVATLDSRTCPVCGAIDNAQWDLEGRSIGAKKRLYSIPPLHFNCRCVQVPVLKSWKELGIDLNDFPPAKRASMDGVVENTDFASWLKKQSPDRIERVLGTKRAQLFQDGKITLDQLVQGGKPLTLEQIKARYL